MTIHWCNGKWLPESEMGLATTDRGATHGLALFETMRAVDQELWFLDEHFSRISESCRRFGWPALECLLTRDDCRAICRDLMAKNDLAHGIARCRLWMSAGAGPLHELARGADAILWLSATAAEPAPTEIAVCKSPWTRNEQSALCGVKCASYAESIIALAHARQAGFGETIFLNTRGNISEAAMANVFCIHKNTLITPPLTDGCLPGVTRAVVISQAIHRGIHFLEKSLTWQEFSSADECFLSSSLRGIVPISRIDSRPLAIGPITRQIQQSWLAAGIASAD